eukprot:TRINITY_DN19380_c0_g2_i2.p3 TRINITY_DN19380_c0_g2~~TRINITY_DN19380_c0_g2_i2.p3  ORF type:complete len:134 (+),score=39.23 TRINITY_DN19380_c0_g2_i2:80-481(+)
MGGRQSALIDQQKQEQERQQRQLQQQLQEQQQREQLQLQEQQEIDRKWISRSSNHLVRRTLQRLAGEDPSFKPQLSSPVWASVLVAGALGGLQGAWTARAGSGPAVCNQRRSVSSGHHHDPVACKGSSCCSSM